MPPYGYTIIALSILVLYFFLRYRSKRKALLELESSCKHLRENIQTLETQIRQLQSSKSDAYEQISALMQNCEHLQTQLSRHCSNLSQLLSSSKEKSMPWLAGMIADFMTYDLEIEARKLDWGHNVQREKKVRSIREIRADAKQRIQESREAIYQLAYLRELFPAIDDVLTADYEAPPVNTKLQDHDPARNYLSPDEWRSLSPIDRDQLALDRYIQSHSKSKWQIGRDYELAVAYEYSKKGYSVDTHGSYMGLEDLGRDIIAKKSGTTLIIQCKHWSESKAIHEKHIYQLYGTTISYMIENPNDQNSVHGVFVTTASLSRIAKQAAEMLGISVVERHKMINFPRIKCNIGHDESGCRTQIYHLPMDDQYDSAKIDQPGEFYAFTVQEAVEKGFRRAYKWHGSS